jgi:hypothetical protein
MEVLDVEVRDPIPMRTPITMRKLSEQHSDSQLALYRGLDSLASHAPGLLHAPEADRARSGPARVNLSCEQVLARNRKFEHVTDRIVYLGDAFGDDLSSTKVREPA